MGHIQHIKSKNKAMLNMCNINFNNGLFNTAAQKLTVLKKIII